MMKSQYRSNRSKYNLDNKFLVDGSVPIYRYLSFFQLVDILERKKLYLQKVCYWDDPSEGSGYLSLMQNMAIKATGENVDTVKSDVPLKDSIKSTYPFGTSWSLLRESDSMWRIYSQDKTGVQIKTSIEKLEGALSRVDFPKKYHEIEDFFDIKYAVGKVDYNPANNFNDLEQLEHFLTKREAFKHEEEIRGLVKFSVAADHQRLSKFNLCTNIMKRDFFLKEKMSLTSIADDFIAEVRIDPRAEDWIVETIKSYCKSKNITNVERSDLYRK